MKNKKQKLNNKIENKINYNPFKMLGSWVGLVIGGILFSHSLIRNLKSKNAQK
jgi:hypothetical protein